MTTTNDTERLPTGVSNLDVLLHGGLPKSSVVVIAGPPGAGKTILTQQLCFQNASPEHRVTYFNTLSEPTAKTLRYLSQFAFFDASKLEEAIEFVDLGIILRSKGLEEASRLIIDRVKRSKPKIVVIDSFKVFDDLARSPEELRKFGYEIAVNLMAWETTALLLGEYGSHDIASNPLFSIVDGLLTMTQREQSGEQQRFLQIHKMRGTEHSRDEHSFIITNTGIEIFAPRVTILREDRGIEVRGRCKTAISKLDDLLGEGIPHGSSLLVAGVAGTGKTVLLLEFIYRGAKMGEKGIVFSFEETEERLRATARGLGWDLDAEIDRGMVEIVFIPQPSIMVEAHLLMLQERVEAMGAKRVAIDSVSVFLHKIKDPQIGREKTFQLASIVQNAQAVGLFATDIPYGSQQISRFGVEETVVDGVILLTATEEGLERQRYLEVYKLRNTDHAHGRHNMVIGPQGLSLFPRYDLATASDLPPEPLSQRRRLSTGVAGLDELLAGGVFERSVTLLSGSAGIGKSTFAMQFIAEGIRQKEAALFVAFEEAPRQILEGAEAVGLPLAEATKTGLLEIVYLTRDSVRANQMLAILADRIRAREVKRLVLDGASHMLTEAMADSDQRQLLYGLITRFKRMGVTSLVTLESNAMYSTDNITDHGFSPLGDNLLALRYIKMPGEIRPSLMIVKTRGSAHDFGTYFLEFSKGGLRVGGQVEAPRKPSSS